MTVIYSFFSVFSVRLGSIIVGTFHLVESLVLLITCMIWKDRPQEITTRLTEFSKDKDWLFMTSIISNFTHNPSSYLATCSGIGLTYSVACVLLIYGALVLNLWLLIPFVILELARLLLLTALVVVSMLLLKKNSLDLGLLMGGSIGGGFLLLLLFYFWACPLSLLQALVDLRQDKKKMEKKRAAREVDEEAIKLQNVSLSKPAAASLWNPSVWQPDPYTDGAVCGFYIE